MKKAFSIRASILMLIFVVSSCATSNDVASNKLIQKRKHLKGYHISSKQSSIKKSSLKTQPEEYLVKNDSKDQPKFSVENELRHDRETPNKTNSGPITEESKKTITASNKNETSNKQQTESFDKDLEALTNTIHKKESTSKKSKKNLLKDKLKSSDRSNDSDLDLIILIILAIFLPPLAVYLFEGITNRFWIDLILALVGIGLGAVLLGPGLAALGALIAVIYALLIVLEQI